MRRMGVLLAALAGCGAPTTSPSSDGNPTMAATPGAATPSATSRPDLPPLATSALAVGPTCEAQGNFCGGHGVADGDPSTLYACAGPGAAPSAATVCSNGCDAGATDACHTAAATPTGPVCPGAGAYCGSDGVGNGDANTLYQCPGKGLAPSSAQSCAHGCSTQPAGSNDFCAAGVSCPGAGAYCGSDGVSGGAPDTLYHCPGAGQAPSSSEACANGCEAKPAGTNDVCRPGLSCPGAGAYCGSDGVTGGDANTLYQCPGAGQPPSSSAACANGCSVQPAGTPDFCAAKLTCPTAGDYCGNDGVGGPANVLYHCSAAGQAPSSSQNCANGCSVQPAGSNDFCVAGGCSALGAAALAWEANQLNSGNSWSDYCLGFVNNAFAAAGNSPGYLHVGDAATSLADARAAGGFVGWNGACPCGAILYWDRNSCNGNYGHVVICNGDGTVSTSGWPGFGGATHASIGWMDQMECGATPAGYIVP